MKTILISTNILISNHGYFKVINWTKFSFSNLMNKTEEMIKIQAVVSFTTPRKKNLVPNESMCNIQQLL